MSRVRKLLVDLAAGTERMVALSPEEAADRRLRAQAERARVKAERAALADLEARRATLAADLAAIADPAVRRVLELVLLRVGETSVENFGL